MKFTAGEFEAALTRKRPAGGESSRPPKKLRTRVLTRPVATSAEATPAGEPLEVKPIVRAVPRPAAAETEEGEVAATTEATVVVLDEEEEQAPAGVAVPEAGLVTVAQDPPAVEGPPRERAPPAAGAGELAGEGARSGLEAAPRAPKAGVPASGPRAKEQRAGSGGPARPPRLTFRGSGATEGPGMVRPARRPPPPNNAVEAFNLLAGLRTEEFEKATDGMTHSELLDFAAVAIFHLGNAAISLREAVGHSSDTLANALAKVKKHREESAERGEKLSRLQAEFSAREANWAGRLREAESRASAAEARAELVSEKLKGALERAGAAEGAATAGKAAVEEARAAKERETARAEKAEEMAREAENRAKEAENQAQKAVAVAERAVADFKASSEFKQEVLEGCLDAYVQGFDTCKSRVAATFQIDIAELDDIQPGGGGEEPEPAGDQDGEGTEERHGGEETGVEQVGGEPAPGDAVGGTGLVEGATPGES